MFFPILSLSVGAAPLGYRVLPMNDTYVTGSWNWTVAEFEVYSGTTGCGDGKLSGLIPFEAPVASGLHTWYYAYAGKMSGNTMAPLNNTAYGASKWDYWHAPCGSPTPCGIGEHYFGFTVASADAKTPTCIKYKACWTQGCLPDIKFQSYDGSSWSDLTPTINFEFTKGKTLYYDLVISPPPSPPAPPPAATVAPIGWRLLPAKDTDDMGDFWTIREFEIYAEGPCTGPNYYNPISYGGPHPLTGPPHNMTEKIIPFSGFMNDGSDPELSIDGNVETYHQGDCQTCKAREAWVGFMVDPKNAKEGKCARLRQCYGTGCAAELVIQKTYDGTTWTDVVEFTHAGPQLITYVTLPSAGSNATETPTAEPGPAVEFSLTVAGTVSDFPKATQDLMAAAVAKEAGVNAKDIAVKVEAASVKITFTITTASASAAAAISSTINAKIGTAADATTFFSAAVPSIKVEAVVAAAVAGSAGLSTGAIVGIAVGAAVGGLLLIVVVFLMVRKSGSSGKKSSSSSS